MKKRYVALLVALILLLLALMVANLYLATNQHQISRSELEQAIAMDNQDVKHIIRDEVAKEVSKIVIPVPRDGNDGRDGEHGKDGVTTTIERKIVETLPGIKGDKGDKGDTGDPAPRIIMMTDQIGDIYYRYEDTTAWTLLMEACNVTKTCEE